VAYAHPLQNPDFHRHLGDLALLAIPLVSVLVSFASVQARPHSAAPGHAAKVTDGADLFRTPIRRVGKRVGGNPSGVRIS